jgi:hypothetical protein
LERKNGKNGVRSCNITFSFYFHIA